MKYRMWFWALVFTSFFCIQTSAARSETPRATLVCTQITPSVFNGKLGPDTVIESTLNYAIDLRKLKREKFSITILFESSEGTNQLFNKKKTRLGEADLFLEKSSGTVKLTYPMDAVWRDARLKRPVSIVFSIIEHEKDGAGRAIASAGPFIFSSLF